MDWPGPLIEATFIRRENRFRARVRLATGSAAVHVPNSGRLTELLVPGRSVFLIPSPKTSQGRSTRFDLVLVEHAGVLVSIDARLPSKILAEAIVQRLLPPFAGFDRFTPEVRLGGSRIDLMLEGPAGRCWVETKSATRVEKGVALFPDAVTERGRRHLEVLSQARRRGQRSAMVFIVQRPDAGALAPDDPSDPAFGATLRRAVASGVEAHAYNCHVDLRSISLERHLPVILG